MQFLIDIGLSALYFTLFLLLCAWAWRFWMMYVNQKALNTVALDYVMLEIKLPREIMKSPLATEMALASLLQGGGVGDPVSKLFKGNLPIFSSLEIASIEGVVHFYVRVQTKFRPLVEANFYAQYPGIEITEAEDYTKLIHYHHLSKDVVLWGANYRTAQSWKPDDMEKGKKFQHKGKDVEMKADFIPIKTYVDYGLDKDPKEEFKNDPLSTVLEIMGSMGKGEHFWYQILIQDESVYKSKMPKFYVNPANHEHISLKDMADARKKQIRTAGWNIEGETPENDFGVKEQINGPVGADGKPTKVDAKFVKTKAISKKEMDLTPEEKAELEAINKKLSKPLAVCVMRALYVAKKENARVGANVQNILSITKPFAGMNSFAPSVTHPYNYDWQNIGGRRSAWRCEEKFEEYVEREGFYPHIPERKSLTEWEDTFFWTGTMKQRKLFRMIFEAIFHPFEHPHPEDAFTLNLEEVATLWHLPGATASTPTLPRIDSVKGVAPANLPI